MSLGVALLPQQNEEESKEAQAGHGRYQGNGNQGRVVGVSTALTIVRIL